MDVCSYAQAYLQANFFAVAARPLRQLRHCLTKNRLTDFFLITLYFYFIFVLFVEYNVCTFFFSLKLQKKLCLAYNCTS